MSGSQFHSFFVVILRRNTKLAINSTETKVENLLKKPIEDLGYTLYDIEYVKQGKEFHLIVYIEKEGGVDLIDCEKVSDVIMMKKH